MKKYLLTAKAKNEGLYIVEWLAWYKLLGLEKVLIITNDNEDHSEELLYALQKAGHIEFIDVTNIPLENDSIGRRSTKALMEWPYLYDYEYIFNIDLDEFLYIQKGLDIKNLEPYIFKFPCLFINWVKFTPGLVADYDPGELLVDRNPYGNEVALGKFFTKTEGLLDYNNAHNALFADNRKRVQTNGDLYENKKPAIDVAFLAHFRSKSAIEFFYRQERGQANLSEKKARNHEIRSFKNSYDFFMGESQTKNARQFQLLDSQTRETYKAIISEILSDRAVLNAQNKINAYYRRWAEEEGFQSFVYRYIKEEVHKQDNKTQLQWALELKNTGHESHDLYMFLAKSFKNMGKLKKALAFCKQGLKLYPSHKLLEIKKNIKRTVIKKAA